MPAIQPGKDAAIQTIRDLALTLWDSSGARPAINCLLNFKDIVQNSTGNFTLIIDGGSDKRVAPMDAVMW